MKRILFILLAFVLLAPSATFAASRCASKSGYTVKYDSAKKKCVYTKKSKWKVSSRRDGITGKPSIFIKLDAENLLHSGNVTRRPYLSFLCEDGELFFSVEFGAVMADTEAQCDVKFDKEVDVFQMETGSGYTSYYLSSSDPFFSDDMVLDYLEGTKTFKIRASSYFGGSQIFTFDTRNMKAAYNKIRIYCASTIE